MAYKTKAGDWDAVTTADHLANGSKVRMEGQSHIVREQVIEIALQATDIDPDVDTVRLVIRPALGRPRAVVFNRLDVRDI